MKSAWRVDFAGWDEDLVAKPPSVSPLSYIVVQEDGSRARVPFGTVLPSLDDSAFCELVFTDSDVKGLVGEAMLRRGDDWRKYVPNYFLATGKAEHRAARVEGVLSHAMLQFKL
jgi:hypothetical protein